MKNGTVGDSFFTVPRRTHKPRAMATPLCRGQSRLASGTLRMAVAQAAQLLTAKQRIQQNATIP